MSDKYTTTIYTYTGNNAIGYTTVNNGIKQTVTEEVARRDGIITNAVPTWAACCGWKS